MLLSSPFAVVCLLAWSTAVQAAYGGSSACTKASSRLINTSRAVISEPAISRTPSSSLLVTSVSASRPSSRPCSKVRSSSPRIAASSASASASRSLKPYSSFASASRSLKPSSSSLSGTSIRASSNTCPSVSIFTERVSIDDFTTVYTGATVTSTFQAADFTTTTVSTVFTTTSFAANSTTTLTATQTITQVTDPVASTTITVPTPPGFTPAACLADYLRTTTTIINSTILTLNESTTFVRAPDSTTFTFTVFAYTTTLTTTRTTLDLSTVIIQSTVTTTSTRPAVATRTIYDACATNNIIAINPRGLYLTGDQAAADVAGNLQSQRLQVPALDPVDCCAQCQALSNCTGSSYYTPVLAPIPEPPCSLWIRLPGLNQTCDPTLTGARAYGLSTKPILFISDSACGQYKFL